MTGRVDGSAVHAFNRRMRGRARVAYHRVDGLARPRYLFAKLTVLDTHQNIAA